jgi:hypothetical protein
MTPPVWPWTFLDPPEMVEMATTKSGKTFIQVVSASSESQVKHIPPRIIVGDSVRIKPSQKDYEAGIRDCSANLHGRITLQKNDAPLTTHFKAQTAKKKLVIPKQLVCCSTWKRLF